MKNKIIIIVIIVVVVVGAALVGVYFIRHNVPTPSGNQGGTESDAGTRNPANTGQPQSKIITDDFSIDLPVGWKQTSPAMGASVMAVNANENINDPASQKINFKSYFAVSYDTLKGKSINEYSQTIKDELSRTFPDVVFAKEQDVAINGNSAHVMEVELTQQGVNFKILMVAVVGHRDDAWVMSFNTTKSGWDGYKETFSDVVKSFSLKK